MDEDESSSDEQSANEGSSSDQDELGKPHEALPDEDEENEN
jgi:hypothetical protein